MNYENKPTFGIKIILFFIVFIGFGFSVLVVLDAEMFHYVLKKKWNVHQIEGLQKAKKSIFYVMTHNCTGSRGCTGTAFLFKPGYVATNKHVITCTGKNPCAEVLLKDSNGKDHIARLEAIKLGEGEQSDIAILSIADKNIPPLALADSTVYTVGHEGDAVVSIGYPLVEAGASSPDQASFSGIGSISMYDSKRQVFVSKNMGVNPGNSGGPVFLIETEEVIGIAVSVLRGENIADVERIIPINLLIQFFDEKIGEQS